MWLWDTAVLSLPGCGFSCHSEMHLNLPVPLAFPLASQRSSKAISDACSEKWSKTCWTEPCCNLSEVQRATSQLTACHGVLWGLVFSRGCEAALHRSTFSSLSLGLTLPLALEHGAGADPLHLPLKHWIFSSGWIKGTTVICCNRTS